MVTVMEIDTTTGTTIHIIARTTAIAHSTVMATTAIIITPTDMVTATVEDTTHIARQPVTTTVLITLGMQATLVTTAHEEVV